MVQKIGQILLIVSVILVLCPAYPQAQSPTIERQLLDTMMPKILLEEYENTATADGYKLSYKTSDGTVREEVSFIMNPGTDKEETVVMGSFGYEDSTGTRTVTMYTSGKGGYRPRVSIKNRKLNPKLLASLAG